LILKQELSSGGLWRVELGKSGLRVSRIGLGVWQASGEWLGKDDQVLGAIKKSHELGVNLLDTAEAYGDGHSEGVVGRALRAFGRDNFVVATKVFGAHLRYDELQRACAYSLRRLGVKEIDLYQIHWPDPWEQIPLKETMRAMEKLYTEGKIRAIGVSNFAVRDLEEARSCLSKTDIVSDQLQYNLVHREIEEEVVPYCRKEGIRILAWSPLAQGALSGKYSSRKVPKGDVRRTNPIFERKNLARMKGLLNVMSKVASRHDCTMSQVALAWLMKDSIVVPIPGAKNADQANENAGAAGVELSAEDLKSLERASRNVDIDYLPKFLT
jgi:aryl-alcohol dehydrogenase-like predicted oxidoreductase